MYDLAHDTWIHGYALHVHDLLNSAAVAVWDAVLVDAVEYVPVLARRYPVDEVLPTFGLSYLLALAIQHWNAAHFVGRPFQYTTLAERRNVTLCRLHPCLGAEEQRYHCGARCDGGCNTWKALQCSLGEKVGVCGEDGRCLNSRVDRDLLLT